MPTLADQYRPRQWSEIIGQDKALTKIRALSARGLAGRAYWISGSSGTGKTSVANLLALEVADPMNVIELDAAALTVTALREFEESSRYFGLGVKPGRAYLVNEAHALKRDVVTQLLVTMERMPSHVIWVFTTTTAGQEKFEFGLDAGPLMSRCIDLALTQQGLADKFAARLHEIALTEHLDGRPPEAYKKLIQRCKNNFRAALMAIEAGEMLAEGE